MFIKAQNTSASFHMFDSKVLYTKCTDMHDRRNEINRSADHSVCCHRDHRQLQEPGMLGTKTPETAQ
jgi:hypothetical protein